MFWARKRREKKKEPRSHNGPRVFFYRAYSYHDDVSSPNTIARAVQCVRDAIHVYDRIVPRAHTRARCPFVARARTMGHVKTRRSRAENPRSRIITREGPRYNNIFVRARARHFQNYSEEIILLESPPRYCCLRVALG